MAHAESCGSEPTYFSIVELSISIPKKYNTQLKAKVYKSGNQLNQDSRYGYIFPASISARLSLSPQGPDSERHSISDRNVNTGALLIAQTHGYLLGLKSIKTL